MSKWTATRLFNFDLQRNSIFLENVFPFLVINAHKGLDPAQLDDLPHLSYFDFTSKESVARIDPSELPTQTIRMLASEFGMIGAKQTLPAASVSPSDLFGMCHEMVMVVRRQMLAYLCPVLFSLRAIDTLAQPNYSIPNIFDKDTFCAIGRQLSLFESDRFCKAFLETSMLNHFLDVSFQVLSCKYRLNQPIPDRRAPLYLFLKAMVNVFEAMPSIRQKSKSFFRFESRMVYSSIVFTKDEERRFRALLADRQVVTHNLPELFDFFFAQESDLKASQYLPVSQLSGTSGSMPDLSVKSFSSQIGQKTTQEVRAEKTVGGDYFRLFREDRLRDLNEKEDIDIANDFDVATDIF